MAVKAGEVQIVPAQAQDAEAIAALARLIWQHHYPAIIGQAQIDYMLAQHYAPELLRQQIGGPGHHWDKLLLDGELIGFAHYGVIENGPKAFSQSMKLDKLYIHPHHQRSGHAGRLIERALHAAKEAGCARLVLAVNKQNKKAIAAYRKYGFRVIESVVQDIGGGFVMDDFIMARDLGSAPA